MTMNTADVANVILGEIAATSSQPISSNGGQSLLSAKVTEEQLSKLAFLFGKNIEKALKIVDSGEVRLLIAEQSGRKVFQVRGHQKGGKEEYLCFPKHYCGCYSFTNEVVFGGKQPYCKHQLAALLAEALHSYNEVSVSEVAYAQLVIEAFITR